MTDQTASEGQTDAPDGGNEAQTGAQGSALREMVADAVCPLLLDTLPKAIAAARAREIADAVLAVILPLGRFDADMHRDTDRQLNAIINYASTRGVISIDHIRHILEQPAGHDSGPTVREAAADDRRWDYERHGE